MKVPPSPKIYHIVHKDNLFSIIQDGYLWSDKKMQKRQQPVTIGMKTIKERRLNLPLKSRPGTYVGEYVPFYFCPRSIMLYLIHCSNNRELSYKGGQEPIIHLEADLRSTIKWADANGHRWAFTGSNAGSYYFLDYAELDRLDCVDWTAVNARNFRNLRIKEKKQAEFLFEKSFPWDLIERIGVYSQEQLEVVDNALAASKHKPVLEIKRNWYY